MPCDRCGAAVVFVQPHSIAVSGFAAGCGGGLPLPAGLRRSCGRGPAAERAARLAAGGGSKGGADAIAALRVFLRLHAARGGACALRQDDPAFRVEDRPVRGCRYAFFLQYGLRAAPWKQAEFDAPLFGSFVHDVLEHVVREAQEQGGFSAMTDGEISALTERCMDNCMKTYLPQGQAAASREGYLSARNRQEAAAVVMDVARELRLSQFAPAAEELRFAPGGPLPPIEYRAKTGSGLLTGQIDRVDTYEADGRRYFRIIDYKTGHKDFDYAELLYGKNLQMLLYLFALESYQRRAGTPMQPAGVLYVPGRCDMVKLKPGEDPAQADAERQKDLRRKGLLLNDEAVLHAMEAYEKKPQYLPFAPGPDGLIGDLASPCPAGGAGALCERTGRGDDRRNSLRRDRAEPH